MPILKWFRFRQHRGVLGLLNHFSLSKLFAVLVLEYNFWKDFIIYHWLVAIKVSTCWESRWEPIASVTDNTVGMAMGIPPIRRTRRLSIPFLYDRCCIGNMTMISRIIPTAIEQMQKFPMEVRTCQKYVKFIKAFSTIGYDWILLKLWTLRRIYLQGTTVANML